MINEKESIIKKYSDGKLVDISSMSDCELRRLQYEEERIMAKECLKRPPFSDDRNEILQYGYEFAHKIMRNVSRKRESYGATQRTVGLVERFIKKSKKPYIYVYEAGVGMGYSCKSFLKYNNVIIRGCDVVLSDEAKELIRKYNDRINVKETTLYKDLETIEDSSIDIFYADNVFEHLFPDEFPIIMSILVKKMKQDGRLFLFIPNKLSGPYDISKYFLKPGSRAEGFHFMEMTQKEMVKICSTFGLKPEFVTFGSKNIILYVKDKYGVYNSIKIILENITKYLPGRFLKKAYARVLALDCYILSRDAN